jgi:hypothetical protein
MSTPSRFFSAHTTSGSNSSEAEIRSIVGSSSQRPARSESRLPKKPMLIVSQRASIRPAALSRDAARREESERVIAYYKQRERRREAAEARAANERQIERRRREGWPI